MQLSGLRKIHKRTLKKSVTKSAEKCANHCSGVSLKLLYRSEFLFWGLFILRTLVLDSEREGEEGVFSPLATGSLLTVKRSEFMTPEPGVFRDLQLVQ